MPGHFENAANGREEDVNAEETVQHRNESGEIYREDTIFLKIKKDMKLGSIVIRAFVVNFLQKQLHFF